MVIVITRLQELTYLKLFLDFSREVKKEKYQSDFKINHSKSKNSFEILFSTQEKKWELQTGININSIT